MYTYNLFVFGHKMSKNKELNNFLCDMDFEFSQKIGKHRYECKFPYHGGVVNGMTYPVVFGTEISDDDSNPNFIDDVRNANTGDYIAEYNEFIKEFIKDIVHLKDELDEEDKPIVDEVITFLTVNKPEFYSVQVSS